MMRFRNEDSSTYAYFAPSFAIYISVNILVHNFFLYELQNIKKSLIDGKKEWELLRKIESNLQNFCFPLWGTKWAHLWLCTVKLYMLAISMMLLCEFLNVGREVCVIVELIGW